ncbi:S-layer homology domain-containing protein [Paenibacillus glufosinatiresistens]|uniref:S-layer homology domain-containing protein n=1 Tax=Paenibacillus glufosinatiresistens TaxID=3070657 RepID=UPI00286DC736|nr:S-layer homology domain-containing protein [Paenibacillus sp. YX.27]
MSVKLFNKALSVLLSFILVFLASSESLQAIAEAAASKSTTVIQNDFIKVTVDNASGRYGIRTVEGQPIRKKDQNVNLNFGGDDPETSFTTFKIDGTDYIFGNRYKLSDGTQSSTTAPKVVNNPNGTQQIETVWSMKGVEIKQILMLYTDTADKVNSGNVNIRYEVKNNGSAAVAVGSRILLDTMVGGNDGPQFQVGTSYKAPLSVERKLVHDPESIGIPKENSALYKLPAYWVMRDKLDLENPLATNVAAYGFNNYAEQNINIVDEMIVGHWAGMANTKWNYTPNPNLDFTTDTNDYGSADSAVAFYWNPDPIAPKGFQSFETVYGLGELTQPDKVFSIRYMDPIQTMAVKPDGSGYENEGIFDITAEVENLAQYNMEHSRINLEMTLQSGLNFVKLDDQGDIVRDAQGRAVTESSRSKLIEYRKQATPAEAEQGIQPKYKPGDTVTVTFKVQAKGKAWPTTREYMLTVKSPETQAKLEGVSDEGIKAQYESNKSNFILLPAVGEATPTYVYGVSPKELYSTDTKYVTVNLSNIEAYNTGDAKNAPNFDLYFRNQATGDRYKVPVLSSVLLQPTDDGSSGDMRITYNGGDKVAPDGSVLQSGLGPELPLGEYQVQIDYKGDAGGDEEAASLYDITAPQAIMVTNNDENRVREAHILAVYKETFDLKGASIGQTLEDMDELNGMFASAPFANRSDLKNALDNFKAAKTKIAEISKTLDPSFKTAEFLDDESLENVPFYSYKTFGSEKELQAFEKESKEREVLAVVRGMVKTVGKGKDAQVIVETQTEPAVINESVAYRGKDLVIVRGQLDIMGIQSMIPGFANNPLFASTFVKGDGTLSVAGSGFVFHSGEWTLDFFNGFSKRLGSGPLSPAEKADNDDNPEDTSINGSLKWASGPIGDRINPLRQLMVSNVYFNRQSLFAVPTFNISGFDLSFNDFILREGGISFGGMISMKVVDAEVNNVIFNNKGFVGIDAALKFGLNKNLGLFGPMDDEKKGEGTSGEIFISHYVQQVEGAYKPSKYGMRFQADLKGMLGVQMELAFKKVQDGRILPDVIAFGAELPQPGILITGGTFLTDIRGAVRELADTIAGGTSADPFPLTVQAGVGVRFGIAPAYFFGQTDLTVKRTGLKIEGKMDYAMSPTADDDERLPMLTKALLEAQWVTPWFVRVQAEVDIGGWDVIVGKAGIFVGQNLEKNRIDFEGYVGSRIQIPSKVPVVGGKPLSSVFLGVNNDKVWGSFSLLLITLGVTYYWGGGVEFGTSSEQMPDGLVHIVINDPEQGPRLMVIGQGIETVATSWVDTEEASQEIVYRDVAKGVQVLESDAMNLGVGGITAKNNGREHSIPMSGVNGNAILEVDYDTKTMPKLLLKDASKKEYSLVFDNTNSNPKANAFTQIIPAAENTEDHVDIRRAYILIPDAEVKNGGTWTLTADAPVDTKLMSVPVLPQLNEVNLAKSSDPNKFTATWNVSNAKAGDTVNLYLTQDAVSSQTTKLASGDSVLEAGDPGMLIAKDLPADSGSAVIDVTRVAMLGGTEDIRGLLRQGNYYLRAELKSSATFGTMTSPQKFEIVDPLAPSNVSGVTIEPAGNGFFSLSFKPGAVKTGQQNIERSYIIEALRQQNGGLESYDNYGEVLMTEEELKPYWNASSGRYEGIPVGGWSATTTSDAVNQDSTSGTTVVDLKDVKYTGLEVGHSYVIGVSAANKPGAALDKNENYHYADRVDSTNELLPVPVKPKLSVATDAGTVGVSAETGTAPNLMTNRTAQTLKLTSNQANIQVEARYAGQSVGKTTLAASGSAGTLALDDFKTDGRYAIELVATNTKTKDISVTMLYLTVDTIAPMLYIDEPTTGERTEAAVVDGRTVNRIRVAGTTSVGTKLVANGNTPIPVAEDGTFAGDVVINSSEPTADLQLVAKDEAGNANSATVSVTNDGFAVPAALVLKPLPALAPGESGRIEAYLKVEDGRDAQGKPKYKEVAISEADARERLSYTLTMGDAVDLTVGDAVGTGAPAKGTVTGLAEGASLIEAEYRISDDVKLTAMVAAEVAVPEPTVLGMLEASAKQADNKGTSALVTVANTGEMTGRQLAYKVFPAGAGAAKPALNQDISDWSLLPADGNIKARPYDLIVVAARTSLDKKAVASSELFNYDLTGSSDSSGQTGGGTGGFGGGGGGAGAGAPEPSAAPAKAPAVTLNGAPVKTVLSGSTAVSTVGKADFAANSGDLVLTAKDAAVSDYEFRIDREVAGQLAASGKRLVIELASGQLILTGQQLTGASGEELIIRTGANSAADAAAMQSIAASQKATLLAAGQGLALQANLTEAAWNSPVTAELAVPAGLKADQVTAIVLKDEKGSWTTVPWRRTDAGFRIKLTGEGHVFLLGNSKSFSDVKNGYWGREAIQEAAAKMFVQGKSGSLFDPESRITRAEYPTLLLRVGGLMNREAAASFRDVPSGSWFSRSVAIASKLGLATGFQGGSFKPQETLSRVEAMTMAGRLLEMTGSAEKLSAGEVDKLLGGFADKGSIPAWAKEQVALSIKYGIIEGENQYIRPQNALTRAQAAAIAMRLDRLIAGE